MTYDLDVARHFDRFAQMAHCRPWRRRAGALHAHVRYALLAAHCYMHTVQAPSEVITERSHTTYIYDTKLEPILSIVLSPLSCHTLLG